MAKFTRTWWGQKFLEALEDFTDPARLGRGRSYARGGRILNFHLAKGRITAKVRGKINPYFGVYKEPLYTTTIEIQPIPAAKWAQAVKQIASKASYVSKLLMNEMPDDIEDAFAAAGLHLLPHSQKDFKTDCSCPDWENPCKHIAGVYYLVAAEFDRDPFLMFELRGLSKQELQAELVKSPLGSVLAAQLDAQETPIQPSESLYAKLRQEPIDTSLDIKTFWMGKKRLPLTAEPLAPSPVPALLIRKQGDFPPFWDKDTSFIEVMENFYDRVRRKNKANLT